MKAYTHSLPEVLLELPLCCHPEHCTSAAAATQLDLQDACVSLCCRLTPLRLLPCTSLCDIGCLPRCAVHCSPEQAEHTLRLVEQHASCSVLETRLGQCMRKELRHRKSVPRRRGRSWWSTGPSTSRGRGWRRRLSWRWASARARTCACTPASRVRARQQPHPEPLGQGYGREMLCVLMC